MVHLATEDHKHCCPKCRSCDVEEKSGQILCFDCGYEGEEVKK